MAEFGFSEAFLATRPDIKSIVDQATEGAWTMDKFLDAVRGTKWWKGLSDAQKAYDVERAENPGEIRRKLTAMQLTIRSMATRMGFNTSSAVGAAKSLAEQAVRNGWSEEEIRLYVGARYSHGGTAGMAGQTQQQLIEMAANYGISWGKPGRGSSTLNGVVRAVLQGVRTVEDYETFIRDQAKRHYSAVASDIDRGYTLRDILDPYIQAAADELGVNPNTVDLTKGGLWTAPVQYVPKGEKAPRAMTQDEWLARIRTDTRYGWDKTNNAQRQASILSTELSKAMGAMG